MHSALHLTAVLERLLYLAKLRKCALEHFKRVEDKKIRVKRSEVSLLVAEKLDMTWSPRFAFDVVEAMRAVGWRSVRTDGTQLWLGVVRVQ